MAAAKTLSPEQLSDRGRKAAAARHSLDAYIDSIVRRAPELTPEQVEKLRPLLAGGAK
ncbi:hypothetical protein [Actinoplanes awajinensis]|uniref:hypothetical protein n=1 Tax=Actinoplanes awajinensis TaxID=135946 RepID=UPI000B2251D7|nr:hypothetical protein [Actinoplanes awajinensis]